jgi:DNA-binding response OmpR family regulator
MSAPSQAPPAQPVTVASKPAVKGSAGRVLLLDDRDDFRVILHEHLDLRGYEVVSVPSGIDGLREVMNARFDLIICDMMMPKLGGEMFYWAVTRARPGAARRFIFFTGHQNEPTINFFFERVNATVLRKPFRMAELDSVMGDVLRKLR